MACLAGIHLLCFQTYNQNTELERAYEKGHNPLFSKVGEGHLSVNFFNKLGTDDMFLDLSDRLAVAFDGKVQIQWE